MAALQTELLFGMNSLMCADGASPLPDWSTCYAWVVFINTNIEIFYLQLVTSL